MQFKWRRNNADTPRTISQQLLADIAQYIDDTYVAARAATCSRRLPLPPMCGTKAKATVVEEDMCVGMAMPVEELD